jgi:hypothetical protein
MQAIRNKLRPIGTMMILSAIITLGYQNCGNNMVFQGVDELNSMLADKQYAEATAGDADSFPPLKLLFVVDNSGTMGINQINLSNAFSRMFAGNNQNNLVPFNATAYVISTSQYVPEKSSPAFSKIPSQAVEEFAAMTPEQLAAHRGSSLSGRIPGDLVGIRSSQMVEPNRTVTSFRPAPVALINSSAQAPGAQVTYASFKERGVSVATFEEDFKKRLALLNPDLSEIDPGTRRGVMDDIIDQESGLCALARVLKHNQGLVNTGDLASVVLVSDENDADPAGRACLESFIEGKSDVDYVDGVCEVAATQLRYRKAIANPTYAKCRVDFQNSFTYRIDYKYPTTDVQYFTKSMSYDQLRTEVSYYTSSMSYDQLRTDVAYYTSSMRFDAISTPVSYYTKAPTYEIPQTSVKYYTEVKNCVIRDGAETNCKFTYPDATVVLQGASGNNCDTFVAGRLPSGALYNKAGYKPVCSAAAPLARSGACSVSDPAIQNCKQNYSAVNNVVLSGKVTSTCDAFVLNRLPSGAVYSDAGFQPMCGNKIVDANRTGNCTVNDADKENCRTVYTLASSPSTLNGVPGSKTCLEFARGRLPSGAVYDAGGASYYPTCSSGTTLTNRSGNCSVSDANVTNCRTNYSDIKKFTVNGRPGASGCEATFRSSLPSGAVLGNSSYPVSCANAATVRDVVGNCSPSNTNIENCRTNYSSALSTNLDGAPTSGCAAFVSGRLPSGAVYSDAGYEPSCAAGAAKDRNVTGSEPFSKFPSAAFAVNGSCEAAVRDSLVTSRNLVVANGTTPECRVTALGSSGETLQMAGQDLTCGAAAWREVCSNSGGAKRSCAATDIAAGDRYEANLTTVTHEGSFTCNTACSETGFCRTSSGTVGDNFYACEVSSATPVVKSSFNMQPALNNAVCAAGQSRRVTRGPYKTDVARKDYVAGALSEANQPNALSDYIVARSRELFRDVTPIVSVFVRQNGDPLGTNGSLGEAYNRLADLFGGKKRSVLASSDEYASALEDLSAVIRERLSQTIAFQVPDDLQVRKVWFRKAGSADWGAPLSQELWTASGGTITLNSSFKFEYGDQFRIEYW